MGKKFRRYSKVNLYVTSGSPIISASNVDDDNLSRNIWWASQLLSSAVAFKDKKLHRKKNLINVSATNHPITRWVRENQSNFIWTVIHGLALMNLYEKNHSKIPILGSHIMTASKLHHLFPEGDVTMFHDMTNVKDARLDIFDRYKCLMSNEWDNSPKQPTWKNREVPSFWGKFK